MFLGDYAEEENEGVINEITKYQREALTNVENMDFCPVMFPLSEYAGWDSFEELYDILGTHLTFQGDCQDKLPH